MSVFDASHWLWKQIVARMWKPAVVIAYFLVLSLVNSHWKLDLFITLWLLALYLVLKRAIE